MTQIFVVDDEPAMGENIQRMLRSWDVQVEAFDDPVRALEEALPHPPGLLLLDVRMPGMSGEELFARFHRVHPHVPVIFLTAFGTVEGAVLAMRDGAFDYLQKPFEREDLLLAVKRALEQRRLEHQVEELRGRLRALGESAGLESRSAAMGE